MKKATIQLIKSIYQHNHDIGTVQAIYNDTDTLFKNYYHDIIMIWGNNELFDYIKNLFKEPEKHLDFIESVYFYLDYQCNIRIENEVDAIEKYL